MAGPLCTPLLLLAALPMILERDSREEEPHMDHAGWKADIRRGRCAGGAELCPQRVKQDQRPREPQPRAAGGTRPQADHAWDELLPGRGVRLNKMPNVDSCPFREQPDLLRKKLWCFQIHTVPWLGKTSVEKSSFQGAQGTL